MIVELLGKNPRILILEAFIDGIGESWTKKDIQEMTGLSKATILNNWEPLEKYGLIKVKRSFGNTKLYIFDKDSKTAKAFLKLEMELAEKMSLKETDKKEAIPA